MRVTDRYDSHNRDRWHNKQHAGRKQSGRRYVRAHPVVWMALVFLAGLVLLMPQLEATPSALAGYAGQTVTLSGTVQESRKGQNYLWLKLELQTNTKTAQRTETIYVSLPRDWDGEEAAAWYPAGTRLQLTGALQLPTGQRNPGGFDEAQWLRSKQARIKLLADEVVVLQEPQGIWRLSWLVQQKAETILIGQ